MTNSNFWAPILGLVGVIVGVMLTAWLEFWRSQSSKKYDFLKQQMEGFYSPMEALQKEFEIKVSLQQKISKEAAAVFVERPNVLTGRAQESPVTESLKEMDKIMKYNNAQARAELFPVRAKMLEIFKNYYWLAEQSTRDYYADFLEYVENWKRMEDQSMPFEMIGKRLFEDNKRLHCFYADIQNHFQELRKQLSQGD